MNKTKPQARTVYANDLMVVDPATGEEIYPHAGEYVNVSPFWTLDEVFLNDAFMNDRANGEESLPRMHRIIGKRLVAWNWTDDNGDPLPKPTTEVIGDLAGHEVMWLWRVLKGFAGTSQDDESPNSDTTGTSTKSPGPQPKQPSPASAKRSTAPRGKRGSLTLAK